MTTTLRSEEELLQACTVLFGSQALLGPAFLSYLQPSGLKSIFRRRARETHPDRYLSLEGEALRRQGEQFYQVRRAYEDLAAFLVQRERSGGYTPFFRQTRPFSPSRERPWWDVAEEASLRYFPERPLLFGHFLQYRGIISWQDIVRALSWQRLNRPRLGELGHSLGMFRLEDIPRIARNQRLGLRFGDSALELGLLDSGQRDRLVVQQRLRQKKFGAYFVERQRVSLHELHELLAHFHRHNFRFRRA